MAILVTPQTRILVQGITGDFGSRHAKLSLDYGTQLVAGVTPGKGGQTFEHGGHQVPIFDTVAGSRAAKPAPPSARIFVPPPFAADAILECVDAGLDLAVAITEGIPVNDMVRVKARAWPAEDTRLIGPNCPGIVTPGTGEEFPRRLPHRHRARLHSQEGQRRRRLAQRHAHLRSRLAAHHARLRPEHLRRHRRRSGQWHQPHSTC